MCPTLGRMTKQPARVARNEALSREVNEGLEEARISVSSDGFLRMVCECGYRDCDLLLAITIQEYESVRQDGRRFIVAEEHVMPGMERVVSEHDRYVVVQKREGTPAAVAEATDPRG